MKYDAIIIGSGQAGFPLAGALPDKGWKVALAEGRWIGGTCINDGCEPTKTLIASARAAHIARRGAEYGVLTGPIQIDFARVMARVHDRIIENREGIDGWLSGIENLMIYRAYAGFEGPNRVRVGDKVIESERIFINTGTRPAVPPIEGLTEVPYLDNTSILELKAVPEHLIVIGGGSIGLEFAQAFRRLGSAVTVIEIDGQLLPGEDGDIADAINGIFENEDIHVHLGTACRRVEQRGPEVVVTCEMADGQRAEIAGSHLLVAAGRKPNIEKLTLSNAGVETDKRGFIVVDDHMRTTAPGVWALGDVNGRGAFTHTSWNEYEILLDNLDGGERSLADRLYGYAVFIDPPLGRIGMTEREVRASGRRALIATKPMAHIGRAIEFAETRGLMKFLVDAETKRFLGASILGMGGDEIIHSIINVMNAGLPYNAITASVPIHPTISELIPTTLGGLRPLE